MYEIINWRVGGKISFEKTKTARKETNDNQSIAGEMYACLLCALISTVEDVNLKICELFADNKKLRSEISELRKVHTNGAKKVSHDVNPTKITCLNGDISSS